MWIGPNLSSQPGSKLSSFGSKIELKFWSRVELIWVEDWSPRIPVGFVLSRHQQATCVNYLWATCVSVTDGPGSHPAITCHIPDWLWSNLIIKEYDLTCSHHTCDTSGGQITHLIRPDQIVKFWSVVSVVELIHDTNDLLNHSSHPLIIFWTRGRDQRPKPLLL